MDPDPDRWSRHTGICSVTLRALSPRAVLETVVAAGLHRIEWGADVHAPPDDRALLEELGRLTHDAGLAVASYGTYWRAGVSSLTDVPGLVLAARALGAPRMRVWAASTAAEEADEEVWAATVRDLRGACAIAADHDVDVALEFHPGTLTESSESTLELLDRVGQDRLRTYWQPRLDEPPEAAAQGLRKLLPVLSAVHVFSWWPGSVRLPLAARADLWADVLALLVREASPCDLLLEFVPDDDPAVVPREAAALSTWLGRATRRAEAGRPPGPGAN